MDGSIEDYGPSEISSMENEMAAQLNVDPSQISITVSAGSVLIHVSLPASAAMSMKEKISSGAMTSIGGKTVKAILTVAPTVFVSPPVSAQITTNSPSSRTNASPTYIPTVVRVNGVSTHTSFPTEQPSTDPTITPTFNPTRDPTSPPTGPPTYDPTYNPTELPTATVTFYNDAVKIQDVSTGKWAIPYEGASPPAAGVPDYKLYMNRQLVEASTFYIRPASDKYHGCVKFGDKVYFSLDNPAWINTYYDAENKWIDFGTTPSEFYIWPEPKDNQTPGDVGGCIPYGANFYVGTTDNNEPTAAHGWFGDGLAYRRSSDALVKFGPGKENACNPDAITSNSINTIPTWSRWTLAFDGTPAV